MPNILHPVYCFIAALLFLASGLTLSAQNTIGGKKVSVPEEEVERQSKFLAAETELMMGRFDKASDKFRTFTYEHPDNDAGWYGLARAYAGAKELDKAVDAIGKAISNAPDNQWYAIYQGDLYKELGRIKDAIRVYENLLKKYPETPEFYEQAAYLYVLAEEPEKGLKMLNKLESLRGITPEVSLKKHMSLVGLNDFKKAGDELGRLADAYPKNVQFRLDLADFCARTGDVQCQKQAYEKVLAVSPNNSTAKVGLASLTAGGKNQSEVGKLQALKPLFADPRNGIEQKIRELMPYFDKIGDQTEPALASALIDLGMAIETAHPDDAKAWSVSGDLFYLLNKPTEALTRYQKCIKLNPGVFNVWENALSILAEQQRYDEMTTTAEAAIDAFPNQPKAYYFLAAAQVARNDAKGALNTVQQALPMTRNNAALMVQLTDMKALAYIAQKDYLLAISTYETVAAQMANDPTVLEHYGDALYLGAQYNKAVEYWKKAYALRKTPSLEKKVSTGKM
ncbi:MAG: tetratricopeptide repeat protein [Saprospiraceae bacterium]|nr:tetratricopeptide repeat protein [Saprospiraceae bacterium]